MAKTNPAIFLGIAGIAALALFASQKKTATPAADEPVPVPPPDIPKEDKKKSHKGGEPPAPKPDPTPPTDINEVEEQRNRPDPVANIQVVVRVLLDEKGIPSNVNEFTDLAYRTAYPKGPIPITAKDADPWGKVWKDVKAEVEQQIAVRKGDKPLSPPTEPINESDWKKAGAPIPPPRFPVEMWDALIDDAVNKNFGSPANSITDFVFGQLWPDAPKKLDSKRAADRTYAKYWMKIFDTVKFRLQEKNQ